MPFDVLLLIVLCALVFVILQLVRALRQLCENLERGVTAVIVREPDQDHIN